MTSIIAPHITEKTTAGIASGVYVFEISAQANKSTVIQEIKALYKVTPVSVRIAKLPAKAVTFKRRRGLQGVRRKAYVQLPAKQTIPGFEVLAPKDESKANSKEKN